jgi:excisionase family DNA binding protein
MNMPFQNSERIRTQTISAHILNAQEASIYLGLSLSTVYHMVSDGRLKRNKGTRALRFRKSDLDEFLFGKSIRKEKTNNNEE